MFTQPKLKSQRQRELDRLVLELDNHPPMSQEYDDVLNKLAKLHKMETTDRPQRVNPDTIVQAVTNILGIAMIIRHEHLNVLTSKAVSFVMKIK